MNAFQVESYNNISIDELLQRELNNPDPNTWVLVFAKARIQQCTQNSLTMALMLLQRDGDKWLDVIKRFSYLEFKLVFSFCIRKMKTYDALMESVYKLGEPDHQRMMQENIEKAFEGQYIDTKMSSNQLWTLYLSYLSQWITHLPHRTLFALQNIERRLSNPNNIYEQLVDLQKAHFIEILCRILRFHEDWFMNKMELRKFWESIGNTIEFLRLTVNKDGLMTSLLVKLKSFNIEEQECRDGESVRMERYKDKRREKQQREKEGIVKMIMRSCEVYILQDLFIYHSQRLATQLLQVPLIDYKNHQSGEELQQLEASLIYQIKSDDFPSLLSQLLVSMGQNIPNFMNKFVSECMFFLTKEALDEMTTPDIILKLCILSKLIIQQTEYSGWNFNIKDLIDKLIMLSDSRSQVIQVKTLLLMHYFKQILPESYFLQYHEIIFRILKHIIIEQISKNNNNTQNQMIQSSINSQLQPFNYKPFQYTKISYTECIKILQEETQRKEEEQGIEMKLRKKKFTNHKYINDLFRNHVLFISDKLIQLITIQGYCEQQTKLLTILRNLLQKCPIVQQRNTLHLIKVLSKQFMLEYDRLSHIVNMRNKSYSKILLLLQCIQLTWGEVTQQTYFECEEHMVPVIELLKDQHTLDFEDDIIRLLSIMIFKAKMITPELNNFIIYSKRVLNNSQGSLLNIQNVLKEMCKPCIVKSVREEWLGLIMYITGIFNQYLAYVLENNTVELYYKCWLTAIHLIQLFLQSYSDEYQHSPQLTSVLWSMQSIILRFVIQNQQTHQLLMTIQHIIGTTKPKSTNFNNHIMISSNNNTQNHNIFSNINILQQFSQLNLYQQRYSLHLMQLTFLDVFNINLRNGSFDFSYPQNPLYKFLDVYKLVQIHIQDSINSKSASSNDQLPFNKINLRQYAATILDSLHRQKLIDIQQFTQLKSIFLPHHYLVSNTLFQ